MTKSEDNKKYTTTDELKYETDWYLATNNDFEWVEEYDDLVGYEVNSQEKRGWYRYIGDNKLIRMPNKINGDKLTSYQYMFKGSDIEAVESINQNIVDMTGTFAKSKAKQLNLKFLDTTNVKYMTLMFFESETLFLDLNSSIFNTSNVICMFGMFMKSSFLMLDLDTFNTKNVLFMTLMFADADAVVIRVNSFDTSNVESMSIMFSGVGVCTLDLTSFDISNVLYINGMFMEFDAEELDISTFDMSTAEKTDNIFYRSTASKVLVRTQADADIINNTEKLLEKLNTVVKKPIS